MSIGLLRMASPHGLVRLADTGAQFRRLGRPARWAFSGQHRLHLDRSNLELLPHGFKALRVVDLGAAKGEWFSSWCHFGAPDRADLFEPNPTQFAALQTRYGATYTLHNQAVGDVAGELAFNITQSPEHGSLLTPGAGITELIGEPEPILKRILVNVVRLDDTLTGEIDLLKLDIQGYEQRALVGARRLLRGTRAVLVECAFTAQYQGGSSLVTIQPELEQAGFHLWDMKAPSRTVKDRRASWADVVFLREDEYERALA